MFQSGGGGDIVVGQLTWEAVKWSGGGRMSEGMLCVFVYTDISQSRQIVGQPSQLWLFSSEELGCVCVYFSVHSGVLTSLAALR